MTFCDRTLRVSQKWPVSDTSPAIEALRQCTVPPPEQKPARRSPGDESTKEVHFFDFVNIGEGGTFL
jgi:hypothetical protein